MDPKEIAFRRLLVEVALTSHEIAVLAAEEPSATVHARAWSAELERLVHIPHRDLIVRYRNLVAVTRHVAMARTISRAGLPDAPDYGTSVLASLAALPGDPMVIERPEPEVRPAIEVEPDERYFRERPMSENA